MKVVSGLEGMLLLDNGPEAVSLADLEMGEPAGPSVPGSQGTGPTPEELLRRYHLLGEDERDDRRPGSAE